MIVEPSISSFSPKHETGNTGVIDRLAECLETPGIATESAPKQ